MSERHRHILQNNNQLTPTTHETAPPAVRTTHSHPDESVKAARSLRPLVSVLHVYFVCGRMFVTCAASYRDEPD